MSETKFADDRAGALVTRDAMGQLADTPIVCIDCKDHFVWTAGEQAFFLDKNLLNPPKRCKECKRAKNRRLAAIELAQMTGKPHKIEVKAECAQCREKTTVPFYPSQGRPVYCRACFDQNKGPASSNGGG